MGFMGSVWLHPAPRIPSQATTSAGFIFTTSALIPALYAGKVVIERGIGFRSWGQRAHKQDKEVVEVRREFREEGFPGFVEAETTLSKVARLPRA